VISVCDQYFDFLTLTISSQFLSKLQREGIAPDFVNSSRLMLKLIYTETALHLELIVGEIADWVEQRVIFAASIGEKIFVNSEKASFLLPDLLCEATAISFFLHHQGVKTVSVNRCDLDQVEVGLAGYWLSIHADSAEGIFVAQLPDRVELYLWQLWHRASLLSVASDSVLG
jgi:hypothetical protein